jgi:hypothetical protein
VGFQEASFAINGEMHLHIPRAGGADLVWMSLAASDVLLNGFYPGDLWLSYSRLVNSSVAGCNEYDQSQA